MSALSNVWHYMMPLGDNELRSYMPSRTWTLFNLYYLFSVLQCDLIAVLFIISCISNFNSFYKDLYRIFWKTPNILRTSSFPPSPRPQTPTLDKPLPLCVRPLWGKCRTYAVVRTLYPI